MTDYSELVKALRHCADGSRRDCADCEYEPYYDCTARLIKDAAAAIEALQKDLTTLQKCYEIADTTVDKVAKQLPKRGEWRKILQGDGVSDYECSSCLGIIMDVPDDDEHPLVSYCPNCGAKMMEVQ